MVDTSLMMLSMIHMMDNMMGKETRVNILQGEVSVHPERIETVQADGNKSVGNIVSEAVPNLTISHSESIVQVARIPNMSGKSIILCYGICNKLDEGRGAKEQAAEEAKEEVAKGGIDVLDKVKELKLILKHAKDGNDMHAGEVCGERSILATELRDLQSRVLYLSDERDKSLAVLDEMCQSLKMRLAAAKYEINNAEQEKLRKQVSDREALSGQECLMERVVQEENILKHHTEEMPRQLLISL